MSVTTRPTTVARVRGTRFTNALTAEFTKTLTLTGWWKGVAVVLLLNLYFAYMNADLLASDLISTMHDGVLKDLDGSMITLHQAVTDAILASPYQSAALLLPLVIAITVGQEYRTRQVLTSAAAVPSRFVLVAAQLVAVSVLAAVVCLAAFVLSDVVLLLMLPPEGAAIVLTAAGLLVAAKVVFYGVTVSIVAGALTTLFRSTLFALVAIVMMFVLALTGAFKGFAPMVHDALPMIGAKSFLFGYDVDTLEPSAGAGVLILLAWSVVAAAAWIVTFLKRDVA